MFQYLLAFAGIIGIFARKVTWLARINDGFAKKDNKFAEKSPC
ncbi:hypothetical protein A33I_17795 [Alkalihalophilus marmarensis DSM 21297]|uniref:Uncharacterized protein n=1 Tax=Alkalihalophilus marmarensis DSM 21297 TaxID=1188261 RepID=U6SK69_9BACI|nr:hypothetical protein A33I_17795 [Alkalihalophilus marmarensis DSM 21297]